MVQIQKGGKKNRKLGRAARKPKTARYNLSHRRERNKLRRVLRSNGARQAQAYARKHGLEGYLKKLLV